MLPIEVLVTFLSASVLLALAPGPDNLFVLAQSAMHGRRAGLAVVAGLCTGLIVHSAAVALGVAAVFQTSATAFTALKFIGAGYLLYLAWQAWRTQPGGTSREAPAALPLGRLYGRGIIMNLTNPKVAVFFLAFLPQFVDPQRGPVVLQIMLLGGLFIAATIVVFGTIAVLAGTIAQRLLGSQRAQRIANRTAALVFIGLAIKLALSQR